ncbi:uncharacterized protein LOC132257004 [Phlebotomus argentipes]|uniref:uncharacterized protein LOC132257004 n=1 Tax=Phlebotomus argentipes TaxID=94469 RepID=UPI002892AAB5|nr:uncharacterized protein LOC132257004 [Phlebotomus argentipes]
MACLDFVILKVNGVDVSGCSHEEAIKVFLTAHEPITVEVRKRVADQAKTVTSKSISVAVQTDLLEEVDVDIEEMTLRKAQISEKIGFTVAYIAPSTKCTAIPHNQSTEAYISNIIPDSIAARDGRLRQGDQILQVNGCDVSSKEETELLFAENPNAVTLLVSRCSETSIDTLTDNMNTLNIHPEHIYETIPEDESEPIYCSPHDSGSDRQLAFEVNKDKLWLDWRPSHHHYVDVTPLHTSISSNEMVRMSRVRPSTSAVTLPAATIYTSRENLNNAIALQERLYRRALERRLPPTTETPMMEWKVKRRHDGTRYIVRRPIETRRGKKRVKWRLKPNKQQTNGAGLLSVTIV